MKFIVLLLLLALPGCTYFGPLSREAIDTYSRAEVEAINLEGQCKQLARTMVQIDRCKVRR
jgi:hypothetical protein